MKRIILTGAAAVFLAAQAVAHGAHDHNHDHDAQIYKGYFEDGQVQERPLSDWQGAWQSVFPLLEDGTLDPVMAAKAEQGDKTAAEYRAYYQTGYRTDVDRIDIEGERVTFHRDDAAVTGVYAPVGPVILAYEKGNRGVRYVFEKTGGDEGAPQVIQFSDHRIAPAQSDHYHLYWGDDSTALLSELTNWPTYYPAGLSADQIVAEMLAH